MVFIIWWLNYPAELPSWAEACKLVLLVQLSSAAAERVFCFFFVRNSFSQQHRCSLEDYVSLSVLLSLRLFRFLLGKVSENTR